ncbi:hypothetical protein HYV79_00435 [Candidatus Woesearchaeota archaeon]|nr:hypothetical protein [Candidatus Woesearchaeota archaeon]
MAIELSTLLKHYKQKDIQEALVVCAENKEVAVKYGENGFGKRPDILQYSNDVLEFAKKGATSFHCSEELWNNPLALNPSLSKNELDNLRIGWDLVLDVDSKELAYSKIVADLIVRALQHHDIESFSVKYSGNHGFHIAVPFECFPEIVHDQEVKHLFPEGPRRIAAYLKKMIKPLLVDKILSFDSLEKIQEKTGKKKEELISKGIFDPFTFVDIDTVLISSRHLYRMPYSFNEKSGLVSIPLKHNEILCFEKEDADVKNVSVDEVFLKRSVPSQEAKQLFIQAFDYTHDPEQIKVKKTQFKEFQGSELAVPQQYFPPCMQKILQGLSDGKKRSLFILTNFLTCCGWNYEETESLLKEWNKKNSEQLRDVLLQGHLKYHQRNKKKVLPPNCDNEAYYKGFGVCNPDEFCAKIKNPANYAILKQKLAQRNSMK